MSEQSALERLATLPCQQQRDDDVLSAARELSATFAPAPRITCPEALDRARTRTGRPLALISDALADALGCSSVMLRVLAAAALIMPANRELLATDERTPRRWTYPAQFLCGVRKGAMQIVANSVGERIILRSLTRVLPLCVHVLTGDTAGEYGCVDARIHVYLQKIADGKYCALTVPIAASCSSTTSGVVSLSTPPPKRLRCGVRTSDSDTQGSMDADNVSDHSNELPLAAPPQAEPNDVLATGDMDMVSPAVKRVKVNGTRAGQQNATTQASTRVTSRVLSAEDVPEPTAGDCVASASPRIDDAPELPTHARPPPELARVQEDSPASVPSTSSLPLQLASAAHHDTGCRTHRSPARARPTALALQNVFEPLQWYGQPQDDSAAASRSARGMWKVAAGFLLVVTLAILAMLAMHAPHPSSQVAAESCGNQAEAATAFPPPVEPVDDHASWLGGAHAPIPIPSSPRVFVPHQETHVEPDVPDLVPEPGETIDEAATPPEMSGGMDTAPSARWPWNALAICMAGIGICFALGWLRRIVYPPAYVEFTPSASGDWPIMSCVLPRLIKDGKSSGIGARGP